MAKKNRPLKQLGREHVRAGLLRSFPFLRKEFREIAKKEIESEELCKKAFVELFGENEEFKPYYIHAIYVFQN